MKKSNNRIIRINDEIRKELSYIIRDEIKDPKVDKMATILRVDTTNDLKFCKVNISVYGSERRKKETIEGLNRAVGYMRRELAKRLNLRNTPSITFVLDDSIEYSVHMNSLLNKIKKDDENHEQE